MPIWLRVWLRVWLLVMGDDALPEAHCTAYGQMREDFERGALIYDASASNPWMIYCAAVGKELEALSIHVSQPQQAALDAGNIAQLRRQIGDLQARVTRLRAQLAAAQQPPQPVPAPALTPASVPSPALDITAEEIAAAGQAFSAAYVAALQRAPSGAALAEPSRA